MKSTVLHGDCRDTLKTIPDGTVQMCVTSPPYWGLRSYLPKDHPDKSREIGQEKTPEAYVETMVGVFREVRRCLHDSGTLWLNVGDSYAGSWGEHKEHHERHGESITKKSDRPVFDEGWTPASRPKDIGLKPKDCCLIPERLLIALQVDGWWVRSKIVWAKKSCMPESVTDRPTNSWEPIFLLAKSSRYFYDAEAVKEKCETDEDRPNGIVRDRVYGYDSKQAAIGRTRGGDETPAAAMRNQRNVWTLGPEPYSEAHFATFPTEIPRRAILAGTSARGCCPKCFTPWERVVEKTNIPDASAKGSRFDAGKTGNRDGGNRTQEGDRYLNQTVGWRCTCQCKPKDGEPGDFAPIPCTVLDPFGGSGTTGAVALDLGRNATLCELNDAYLPLIDKRTNVTKGFPGLA